MARPTMQDFLVSRSEPYICSECGKGCRSLSGLTNHKRKLHPAMTLLPRQISLKMSDAMVERLSKTGKSRSGFVRDAIEAHMDEYIAADPVTTMTSFHIPDTVVAHLREVAGEGPVADVVRFCVERAFQERDKESDK